MFGVGKKMGSKVIPPSIPASGLVVKLDATISGSITKDGSNNVSLWADQSGNGNDFGVSFAGSSFNPKYNATLFSSVPGIDFSVVSQSMLQCATLTALTRNGFSAIILGARKAASQTPWILWDRPNNKPLLTMAVGSRLGYSAAVYGREVFPMGALDVIGYTNDGSPHHWWNGIKFPNYIKDDGSLTADTGNFGNQTLLGSNPNASALQVAGVLIYNRAISDAEMKRIYAYLAKQFNLSATRTPTANIIHDGDSISNGQGAYATPYFLKSALDAGYSAKDLSVVAIGGQILSQIITSAPTQVDPLYNSNLAAKKNVVVMNCLANTVGSTADATVESQIQSYCQARQSAGFKVIVCTSLPRGDKSAAYETSRGVINTWIRANYGTFADALADLASEATMGNTGTVSNNTYFQDTVHPTNAGHALLAPYVTTALTAIMT
jgi:hypothetical protein